MSAFQKNQGIVYVSDDCLYDQWSSYLKLNDKVNMSLADKIIAASISGASYFNSCGTCLASQDASYIMLIADVEINDVLPIYKAWTNAWNDAWYAAKLNAAS